jgi:hypothetical protein
MIQNQRYVSPFSDMQIESSSVQEFSRCRQRELSSPNRKESRSIGCRM